MAGDLSVLFGLFAAVLILVAISEGMRPFIVSFFALRVEENTTSKSFAGLAEVIAGTLSLALLLSLNQFFGLRTVLPSLLIAAGIGIAVRRPQIDSRLLAYMLVALAGGAVIAFALNVPGFWLTEGVNHDAVLYVRGGEWALDHGTLATDAAVNRALVEGRASAGCFFWIGDACAMHRGGTHSLVGLTAVLRGEVVPTASFLVPLLMTVPLFAAVSLNGASASPGGALGLQITLALMLAVSAPILTSLANGNIATALGTIVIVCSALVFLSPAGRKHPAATSVSLGALSGLAAHVYSESMWVAAAFTALHCVVASSPRWSLSWVGEFVRLTAFALAAWLIAGNVSIWMALKAFLTVSSEVSRDLYWPNYYLDGHPWVWLSMPFAGWLEGTNQLYPAIIGAAGTLAITLASGLASNRLRLLTCLAVVTGAVLLIEWQTYFYGVHKVVQIFGPLVLATGAACLLQRGPHSKLRPSSVALTAIAVFVVLIQAHAIFSFSERARMALEGPYAVKSMTHGEAALFYNLNDGDTLLVNDLSLQSTNRFSRTQWITYLGQREGAEVVMGSFGGDAFRGAYAGRDLERTLAWQERIDWVVDARETADVRRLVNYDGAVTATEGRFELTDLRDTRLAAVFLSSGFHERELDRVWTSGTFTIEAVAPDAPEGLRPALDLQLEFFAPPVDGRVSVLRNQSVVYEGPAVSGIITLPLTDGYQTLEIRPSWAPVSPADIGVSADSRKLFASVFSITSRMMPATTIVTETTAANIEEP